MNKINVVGYELGFVRGVKAEREKNNKILSRMLAMLRNDKGTPKDVLEFAINQIENLKQKKEPEKEVLK